MKNDICHELRNKKPLMPVLPDEQKVNEQDSLSLSLLRPSLFWDVNPDRLDADRHAAFIIVRVMERGTREDVNTVWHYYGEETIKIHLLAARSLHKKTISYFANKFSVSRAQFKSFHHGEQVQPWP